MSNRRNLANAILKDPVSDSATTWELVAGYGDAMPPAVPYHLTATPFGQLSTLGNSEVVLVTARTLDTLTVVRGQKGTTAQSFLAGAVISNGIMVDDVIGTEVTVSTAATTAAKVGTTADGNYTPVLGDRIIVTFVNGSNVNTPTLNIDGSGAKNIRLGQTNASTLTMGLGTGASSNVKVQMWYGGTYWQLYGANDNTNTTYTEISEAEITTGTASTVRVISGRRAEFISQKAITAANTYTDTGLSSKENLSNKDTDGTLAANSDTKYPSQKAVKTYVDTFDYITLGQSSNFTVSSGTQTLNLDTVVDSLGTKLSRSGSTVLIGSGVSLVRVSYALLAESLSSSAAYLYVLLKKNTTTINQLLGAKSTGAFAGASATLLVPVVPGDTISLGIDFAGGSVSLLTSRPNTMTVEVVK